MLSNLKKAERKKNMHKTQRKETIKIYIIMSVLIIITILAIIINIKYSIEGETDMAFNLSKIMIYI